MDSDLQIPDEIRHNYLIRREKDLQTLKSSLAIGDLSEFKRIGHQLKGNASSFGYLELESIAIAMEKAAADGDGFEAGKQLELFESWCSAHR